MYLSQNLRSNVVESPTTFSEAWNLTMQMKWCFNPRKGYDEQRRYDKHLAPIIGEFPLNEISPLLLEQMKLKLLSAYSAQTVIHVIGLVRQVYNHLIKWELWKGDNPASHIQMPKADNARQRFLTQEEALLLLAVLKQKSLRVWQISLLAISTGMRAGEIATLKGEHIDLAAGTVRVVDTKTHKNRTVYLPTAALQMLRECTITRGKYVFPDQHGKPFRAVSDTFSRTVRELGLNEGMDDRRDWVCFHTLRHTFASWLAQADQPMFLVADLMGHKTLAMTKRYAHLNPQRKIAASTVLDGMIAL